jgi:hypothetical protein
VKNHYRYHIKNTCEVAYPNYILEPDSILNIDIAIMILSNTDALDTFYALLLSHSIFRHAIRSSKSLNYNLLERFEDCMTNRYHCNYNHGNMYRADECMSTDKCKFKRLICLKCCKCVCTFHSTKHADNVCYENILPNHIDIFKSIIRKRLPKHRDKETLLETLKYANNIINLIPDYLTQQIVDKYWLKDKYNYYWLIPIEFRTSDMYIELSKKYKVSLSSLQTHKILKSTIYTWYDSDYNTCDVMLPDDLGKDFYINVVKKHPSNITYINKNLHTAELISILPLSCICLCNPHYVSKDQIISYIKLYGIHNINYQFFLNKWPNEIENAKKKYDSQHYKYDAQNYINKDQAERKNEQPQLYSGLMSLITYGPQNSLFDFPN